MPPPPNTPQPAPSPRAPLFHLGHPDAHVPKFVPPDTASPPLTPIRLAIFILCAVFTAFLGLYFDGLAATAATPQVPLLWSLPFLLLLVCIATMPFAAQHFWEKHYHHVAIALALLVAGYYLFGLHAARSMAKNLGEYISFIFLLGSLFTVSGGILIRVRRKATPQVNVALLLAGALLANVFGTTGAAMLLIRPYLHINKAHLRPYHIVFFIFLVANVGGSLTPIGDPPLFLGYLKGVPFWWVAQHCWPMWLVAVGLLLILFFIFDTRAHAAQPRHHHDSHDAGPAISIFGLSNLLLVIAILAGILLHEQLLHLVHIPWRELIMTAAVAISLAITPQRIHIDNVFNFAPIREVAFLFLGIFATMVPALNYLSNHANDAAFRNYLHTPGQFYYQCGTLSSVLDNAPTYLTFLQTEIAKRDNAPPAIAAAPIPGQSTIPALLADQSFTWRLIAISLASVFFGAMTYIGNGPNFMVKSIAAHANAPTPSFFQYLYRFSLPILLPILILIWALFLLPHPA
ncbi:MAG TPA: sodium:proton antiporter [Phycisphaerae bacterium]|nr:sodium:proton antiporter [Phycisphaerae bacterium]